MMRTTLKMLAMMVCLAPLLSSPGFAQQGSELADSLSPRLLFMTSGGYWETQDETSESGDTDASDAQATTELKRGYYRLIAIRGEDNRSLLQLQQIALGPDGPVLETSMGIDEINSLGGYITDIRPEDSTGAASKPGFGAYIYLKTDPSVVEPETWALYIDEFGDIMVEQSSN